MPLSAAERVAQNVRAELARRRQSQTSLAAHLGLAQTAVSRRLSGRVAFDVNELTATAEWLGVPVGTLLEDGASAVAS